MHFISLVVFRNNVDGIGDKRMDDYGWLSASNDRKLSLQERIARLGASPPKFVPVEQGRTNRIAVCINCHRPGHFTRDSPEITYFRCGRRGHMHGSTRCQNQN